MTDDAYFIQLFLQTLRAHGAAVQFTPPPQAAPDRLSEQTPSAVLAEIAAALRSDASDFACIDRIIALLEPLGYTTTPRHDFG